MVRPRGWHVRLWACRIPRFPSTSMNPSIRCFFGLALLSGLPLLAQTSPAPRPDLNAWMDAWRAQHGSSWAVALDAQTGYAEMLYGGSAFPIPSEPRTDEDFVVLGAQRLPGLAELTGIPANQLEFVRTVFLPLGQAGSSDKQTIRYRQVVNGIPVQGGFVNLLFAATGELLSVQSTGLPQAADVGTLPALDQQDGLGFARQRFEEVTGLEANHLGTPELVIAQLEQNGRRVGKLSWKVELMHEMADAEPVGKRLFIDAATGALLKTEETVHHFDVGGNVKSYASPGTLPDSSTNPETLQNMPRLRCQAGATTVYTDLNGNFNFPGVNSNLSVTFTYVGNYASVNYSPGADYSLAQTCTPGSGNVITLNPTSGATITPQANAFLVSTMMRDWVRSIIPTDNTADFVTVANVNVSGSCNAFYNGNSINFYPAGGGCVNTSYSTVITHEQGHWLNDRYSSGNGGDGFGEGNADNFAMYMWDTPVVGANFSGNSFIRTGTNTRQFCGDSNPGCYGQVHTDGEVLMGACWKVRNNLNTALGNSAGDLRANTLFLSWMNSYNQGTIRSIIETQWITLDDNNGNITDGSPNFTAIDTGFRTQGFPGLTVTCPTPITGSCTQSPNSAGPGATLGYSGQNKISTNNFQLVAIGLPPNKTGLFFFGQNQTLVPLGSGFRCVNSPFFRTPATTSNAFGDLTYALNLNALPGGASITAGQTWFFQAWFRDNVGGTTTTNTSTMMEVKWCQ